MGAHALADREACNPGPDFRDGADRLVAGNERHGSCPDGVYDAQVRVADAAGIHIEHDFAGARGTGRFFRTS